MRGLSNEEADRMIAAQMPAERKRPRSQFVIDNDGSLAELERRARVVFEELRRSAARAALGRPAQSLLLAAATSEHPALSAIADRYSDAGLAVRRVASAAAGEKALAHAAAPPDAIVAAPTVAAGAEGAVQRAGSTGAVVLLSCHAGPVARRFELARW